jgi:4-diphosphocytidyl-2-C-methyl-D-erythritol kinase
VSDNLVMRAAHAWHGHPGRELPNIHVHLDKRIPMGAGLGGGSSDAATILQILNDDEAISEAELQKLASSIGADVPFFLSNTKAAIASGIGDMLTPIDFDLNASILIVFDPSIHVSTKEAYAGITTNHVATNFAESFKEIKDLNDLRDHLRNDFEPSVFAKHPRLEEIKQELYDQGASLALMSGSGSALFGLFESEEDARHAKTAFENEGLLAYL